MQAQQQHCQQGGEEVPGPWDDEAEYPPRPHAESEELWMGGRVSTEVPRTPTPAPTAAPHEGPASMDGVATQGTPRTGRVDEWRDRASAEAVDAAEVAGASCGQDGARIASVPQSTTVAVLAPGAGLDLQSGAPTTPDHTYARATPLVAGARLSRRQDTECLLS